MMSRDAESVMSSAVSISGTESFSDDGSTPSLGGDMGGVAAGNPGSSLFDLGDGDLHIAINGATLETHKFLVKRFATLKDRIKNETIILEPGEPGLEIFKNAFKILYASVVEGPFEFDHAALTSALILATKYHYPALRAFAITKLENATLSAVERIRLAREFDIPLWEEPAYLELCERDEAITMSEAGVLGLEAVVHVAKIREKEQRRRGKEVDAAEEIKGQEPDDQVGVSGTINALETLANSNPTNSTIPSPKSDMDKESEIKSPENNAETNMKPCFIGFPEQSPRDLRTSYSYSPGARHRLGFDVPGCECKVEYSGLQTHCQCKLPPCAVSAFKHLQTQQRAHKDNISALETTVEQIQVALSQPKPTAEYTSETAPTPSLRPSTLRDDVRNWLGSKRRANFES